MCRALVKNLRRMTRLVHEIEQLNQGQSRTAMRALPFVALTSWQFGAVAAALISLLVLIGLLRKRRHHKNFKAGSEEEEVIAEEEEEDPSDVLCSGCPPMSRHAV